MVRMYSSSASTHRPQVLMSSAEAADTGSGTSMWTRKVIRHVIRNLSNSCICLCKHEVRTLQMS